MKRIFTYSLIVLGTLAMLSMSAPIKEMAVIAPQKQFKKTIEKSFPISKKGEVAIINKYGNIDMHTWDKSEVQFKVTIKVTATSQSVAEDVFEKISVSFEDGPDRVLAQTEIETKSDYWWNWGRNIKSDFEINYQVYMPISCKVDFANRYGNLDMMDLENDARLDIRYGNFTMGDLDGDLALILAYGNGYSGTVEDVDAEIQYSKIRMESVKNMNAETKYSEMVIKQAEKLLLESKYDQYDLGKIGELVNEGKYDNFKIESCSDLTMESKYTDVKIGSLSKALTAELSYGGIRVDELRKGFDNIAIESAYTGVELHPVPGTPYTLDVDSRYVDLDLPDTPEMKDKKDGAEHSISTRINGGGKSSIRLDMEYGFLKIK